MSRYYQPFLRAADTFWRMNLPISREDNWIVAEAMHEDVRVLIRTLTVANAIRRETPARLLVLTGTDDAWRDAMFKNFDQARIREIATAYGADEIIDVHEETAPAISELTDRYARATACRLDLLPRLPDGYDLGPRRAKAGALAAHYAALFRDRRIIGLVTSHVDYDQWGLAAEAAVEHEIPLIHVQLTGSLKAYALFPETRQGEPTIRAELTRQIGALFEQDVWSHRERLRPGVELVAWRARENLGRPAWWRAGSETSFGLRTDTDLRQFAGYTARRLGLDPNRPTVTVFNHAVSDALGTNREAFPDLAAWLEETAHHARHTPEVNWLFLEHPKQRHYDSTGHFAALAARAEQPGVVFRRSEELSKNALWSLTDLGLTVRGSVSNELPAFGIPVIQAGWSEWSGCGMSTVAAYESDYWKELGSSVERLCLGADMITAQQVERARLWLWFYRSAADVPTPFVPQWEIWPEDLLFHTLETTMRYVETDHDPLFTSVRRMWHRREPCLTRFDLREAGR